MPELPEVETVKNELLPYVIGRKITKVTLLWEGIVKEPSAEEFRSRLVGQAITGIARRGKYLPFSLSSGDALIIHLKMTGSLLIKQNSAEPPEYTRAVLYLDNDTALCFRDPRKFGVMRLVNDKDTIIGKLGPEPLEAGFTPQLLAQILAKRKTPMKALLCEQHLIAGIGSMYADEALFATGIHPLRTGESLTQREIESLHRAIRRILWAAIENKGASVNTYYRPDGTKGTAHNQFKVAHRFKQPCFVCGTPIERIKVRNRGSYFCPRCQPLST
ncbi:MAG: bifunctional DNA-formamidopyrimidine glycosylase/DNA-(apurinic or apyrimidinic site) lyase [Dehalococcoidales bacterium]|nr:bifunctional DNA-formamidopyrimidine glycosylase/DNA-(apurinic or apyrimidinic site) lyase [Dehalococcoidales bacterium]